jgi:hypothetical protein
VSPRPGRRIGRTRLTLLQVEARHRGIAKVDAAEDHRIGPVERAARIYQVPVEWVVRPGEHQRLATVGHHLQRAAAENA